MIEQPSVGTVSERLHALDLVRSAALLLGIVFHAALPYMTQFEFWLVLDSQRSEPVTWLAFTLHTFRMTTFFLLAGFFGRMMYHRKGSAGFIKDRAKRILGPLVAFWIPVMVGYGLATAFAAHMGATPKVSTEALLPSFTVDGWPLTHLWFLYLLLLIYAATLLLRMAFVALDRSGIIRAGVDKVLAEFVRFPLILPVLLAVPVGFLLQHHHGWAEWWGIPTPDRGIVPNPAAFFSFALAFWLGWLAHRLNGGLTPLARLWLLYLSIAVVLTAACLILTKEGPKFAPQFAADRKLIFASLYGLAAWLWTFGLIGAALRFIRRESPKVRYLADSSYWLYIIHLPILVALEAAIASWPIPAELKLVLVVGVGTTIMLASYHWLVRFTWLGAWLNGKRRPRKPRST